MNPKTNLLLVGSSHFAAHRNFKNHFEKLYHGPEVGSVIVSAHPGKSLNLDFIEHIFSQIENRKHQGRPLIIVVMFACNGVRSAPTNHAMVPLHAHLLRRLQTENHIKVILCGLIPSKNLSLQEKFTDTDRAFHRLTADYPSSTLFFDTASLFGTQQGYKYSPLCRDGVHLTPEGANVLVTTLHFFIHNVALPKWRSDIFGIEPLSLQYAAHLHDKKGARSQLPPNFVPVPRHFVP